MTDLSAAVHDGHASWLLGCAHCLHVVERRTRRQAAAAIRVHTQRAHPAVAVPASPLVHPSRA